MKLPTCLPVLAFLLLNAVTAQDCYTSTKDIFEAQLADVTNLISEYVICAGTEITVGPPRGTGFFFDFPLILIKPNVTVKCAIENACKLRGFRGATVLISAPSEMPSYGLYNIDVSNTVVEGLELSGFVNGFRRLQGMAVSVSATTSALTLRRNSFNNVDADFIVNISSDSGPGSASVTVEDSSFYNVFYRQRFFEVVRQELTVVNNLFVNTQYRENGDQALANGSFFSCIFDSVCTLTANCLNDLRHGQAVVLAVSDATVDSLTPTVFTDGLSATTELVQKTRGPSYGACEMGLLHAVFDETNPELSEATDCEEIDFSSDCLYVWIPEARCFFSVMQLCLWQNR